jgi:hypothetical protein
VHISCSGEGVLLLKSFKETVPKLVATVFVKGIPVSLLPKESFLGSLLQEKLENNELNMI